ncbi:MAG: hypothetical protein ACI9YT_000188 [Halobacteriales archaeon]|jgi:hypothetical protein
MGATSSTVANRLSGIFSRMVSRTDSGTVSSMAVRVKPGATQFAVDPLGASSMASVRVRPNRPAFAAA